MASPRPVAVIDLVALSRSLIGVATVRLSAARLKGLLLPLVALAAGAMLVNLPGVDPLSRYTRTKDLLFRIRKNLFETLTLVARKPSG